MTAKHEPTTADRERVSTLCAMGISQLDIGKVMKISRMTLKKHYRDELDLSMIKANATVAAALFKKASSGHPASMFFWLKTRARWTEKAILEHTGPDGKPLPAAVIIAQITDQTELTKAAQLYADSLNAPVPAAAATDTDAASDSDES